MISLNIVAAKYFYIYQANMKCVGVILISYIDYLIPIWKDLTPVTSCVKTGLSSNLMNDCTICIN